MFGTGMRFTRACTARQFLAWEVRQGSTGSLITVDGCSHWLAFIGLIGNCTYITGIVSVGPLLKCTSMAKCQVEHQAGLTMPSRLAPYPALPTLPIVQIAGHSPNTLFAPGKTTAVSIKPPVKQNLFQVDIIPPV